MKRTSVTRKVALILLFLRGKGRKCIDDAINILYGSHENHPFYLSMI